MMGSAINGSIQFNNILFGGKKHIETHDMVQETGIKLSRPAFFNTKFSSSVAVFLIMIKFLMKLNMMQLIDK